MAGFDPIAAARRFAELEASLRMVNADPAYDANALVQERLRDLPPIPGERSSYGFGYIDPKSISDQWLLDPPSMWFKQQPIPPPPQFR